MKRLLIVAGLLMSLTTASLGIAYACTCKSAGGAGCCGENCRIEADGNCYCEGKCIE